MKAGSWDGLRVGLWRCIIGYGGWKQNKTKNNFGKSFLIDIEKNSLARSRGVYWIKHMHTDTHTHTYLEYPEHWSRTIAVITLLSLW